MEKIESRALKIDATWRYLICFLIFCLIHIFLIPEDYAEITELFFSLGGGSAALVIFIAGCRSNGDNTPYRWGLILTAFFYLVAKSFGYREADTFFYILANLSLGFAVYHLIKEYSGKWSRSRMLIDGFFTGGVLFFGVWEFFVVPFFLLYIKNEFILSEVAVDSIYIFINLTIIFFLSMLYSLEKNYLYNMNNIIQALGFFMWSVGNIVFQFKGIYEHARFVEAMWPVALLLIAVSSVKNGTETELQVERERNSFSLMMIILSLAVVYYGNKEGLFALVPLLLFKYIFSRHIDVYERNELLNAKYIESNGKLYEMANKDELTGIYNRRRLIEELENLTENRRQQGDFALLFVDLDRFKNINDTYGHDVGDLLLKESVKRFQEIVEERDFVARQGGDEFVIIFKDIRDKNYISEKCREILNSMEKEFVLSGKKIKTSASIGVALYPEHAQNYMELIKCGDRALYKSKAGGKNRFYIYDEELQKIQDRRFLIENRLQNARIRKELYLLYQPQIDMKTGKMVGMEALLRWKNSELGEVSPQEFIPIAEEIGTIHSLGEFAIVEATKDIRYLNEKHGQNLKVGINVSPKQFFTDGFFLALRKNMAENRINPRWLDIEITENMAMSNEAEVIRRLEALTRLGVSISIDDFGTGYSSLAYLKNYPVTTLKIAMELIRDLDKGKQDYNIVKAVTAMCREMGIETIAEGVENSRHFQILKDFGCDRIQGYYASEPIRIGEIEEKFLN